MLYTKFASRGRKERDDSLCDRFLHLLGCKDLYDTKSIWPLPNMKEIREVDYWWYRSSYLPKAQLHTGQIKIDEVDPHPRSNGHPHWGNLYIYLSDHGSLVGGGHAVLWTYNWMDYHKENLSGNWDPAFPAVRYFTWQQCAHDFAETGPLARRSRGWHVYTCTKCGAQYTVDSGD